MKKKNPKHSFTKSNRREELWNRDKASSNCFLPMISVDSNISLPGPEAMHNMLFPLQVEVTASQGKPKKKAS